MVENLQQLDDLLGTLDLSQEYPGNSAEGPRGRAGSPKRTALPEGWLESNELSPSQRSTLLEAELDTSGG
jgi:hypothetical protein